MKESNKKERKRLFMEVNGIVKEIDMKKLSDNVVFALEEAYDRSKIVGISRNLYIYMAKFLAASEYVSHVTYCDLPGDKFHEVAKKYLPNGSCGVVSFTVKGGRKAAENFMKHLKLIAIETHVADARSCCLHPASSTHRQMTDEELAACGVSPDLVRLSCGIENADDLIADVRQALEAAHNN